MRHAGNSVGMGNRTERQGERLALGWADQCPCTAIAEMKTSIADTVVVTSIFEAPHITHLEYDIPDNLGSRSSLM